MRGTRSHAPAVGDLRATGEGAGRAVVIITRGDGRGEIRAVEAEPGEATGAIAHLHHAVLAIVGREGGTVGDRPTTDEVVGQVRRTQGSDGRSPGCIDADLDLRRRDDARDGGTGGDIGATDHKAGGETGGARYRDDAVRIRGTDGSEVVVRRTGGAVDLLDNDRSATREGLVTKGVVATGVIVGPTVHQERLTSAGGEDEVADVETDSAAHVDVGEDVDCVTTGTRGERVDADRDIGRARTIDAEFAADQGDRSRRIEASRVLDGVEAIVVETECPVVDLDGASSGEGALIAEVENTTADNRQASVRARAGENRGGVTRTDQVHLAGDRAREGAVTVGREVDEGGT